MHELQRSIAAITVALAGTAAWGAGSEPPSTGTDKLANARSLITEARWAAAIDELKRVNDSGNAEWNNLMGYSLRKARTPDYAAAERYYDAALRIDPQHRGALEYSGELYLMTGRLDKAEARLAALEKACSATCEEYADLKKAIERYKATGK